MSIVNVHLTIESNLYDKLQKRAEALDYANVPRYINALLRHSCERRGVGGRIAKESSDTNFVKKFASPTSASRKITRWARKAGLE